MPHVLQEVGAMLKARRAAARKVYCEIVRRYDAPEPGDAERLVESILQLHATGDLAAPMEFADRDCDRVKEYRRLRALADSYAESADSARAMLAAATEAKDAAELRCGELNRAKDPAIGKARDALLDAGRAHQGAEMAAKAAAEQARRAQDDAHAFRSLNYDLFAPI